MDKIQQPWFLFTMVDQNLELGGNIPTTSTFGGFSNILICFCYIS